MTPTQTAKAEGLDELSKRLDDLTEQMALAQHELNMKFIAWDDAARKVKRLTREREIVWSKMLDTVISPATKPEGDGG